MESRRRLLRIWIRSFVSSEILASLSGRRMIQNGNWFCFFWNIVNFLNQACMKQLIPALQFISTYQTGWIYQNDPLKSNSVTNFLLCITIKFVKSHAKQNRHNKSSKHLNYIRQLLTVKLMFARKNTIAKFALFIVISMKTSNSIFSVSFASKVLKRLLNYLKYFKHRGAEIPKIS